jgi:GAF domain-containing protein
MANMSLEDFAQLARLAEGDDDPSHVLQRLVDHATSLVPGCTAACLTVATPDSGHTAAVTDERVDRCHAAQFAEGGTGPARDALRFNEPRRIDDINHEERWPTFCTVAREHGFASCLALPLLTDRTPSAALNLYADEPRVFAGTTHDAALFFAAQGGVALDNAVLYRRSQEIVEHLHRTLVTRSIIERAKGLLMSRHQLSSTEAFELLRTESQHSHRRLSEVAAALVEQHDPECGAGDTPWTPVRHRSGS